jgi:serine/threonine protein kinase
MSATEAHHDSSPNTCALDAQALAEISRASSPAVGPFTKEDISRDDLTGLTLGPYALGAKIGGGGMGKVFAARHVSLDKTFAVKFIGQAASTFPEARNRFDQEVRALGKLQHPNIVSAVDAGTVDDIPYLVTELVAGEDLAQLVARRGPIPVAEACELVRQAAVGLAHSHRLGFLHRDIKPSNLVVDQTGTVKILDFGLVRGGDDQQLTQAGEMLGTWDFVAPEQTQDARHTNPRSDLYALGCTLLYLLSGRPPFGGEKYSTPATKLKGHLFDEPTWFREAPANVPPEVIDLARSLTAKSPDRRPADGDEVARLLAPWARSANVAGLLTDPGLARLANQPPFHPARSHGRRRSLVGIAAAALGATCVLAAAAIGLHAEKPESTETNSPQTAAESAPTSSPTSSAWPAPGPWPALTPWPTRGATHAPNPAADPAGGSKSTAPRSAAPVTNPTERTINAGAIRLSSSSERPTKKRRSLSSAP